MKKVIFASKRQVVAMIVLLVLALPMQGLSGDIAGHPWEEAMNRWSLLGWFTGNGTETYRPDAPITRAEFMALVNRMEGYRKASPAIDDYIDVSPKSWYYDTVSAALKAGYLNGTGIDTMSPNAFMTRQQAWAMIARFRELTPAASLPHAPDWDEVTDWGREAVAACIDYGLFPFFEAELVPHAILSRAESVALLDALLTSTRYYVFAGTYGPERGMDVTDTVIVSAKGVTLQNLVMNRLIYDGIEPESVTLINCIILGEDEQEQEPERTTPSLDQENDIFIPVPGGNQTPTPTVTLESHNAEDMTVPFGTAVTALGLPDSILLTATDGSTVQAVPLWDTSSYNATLSGMYPIIATLTCEATWSPATLTIWVTVEEAVTVIDGTDIAPITIPSSATAEEAIAALPDNLMLTLSNGQKTIASLQWQWEEYDATPGAVNLFTALLSDLASYIIAPVITAQVLIAQDDTPVATAIEITPLPAVATQPKEGERLTIQLTIHVYDQFGGLLNLDPVVSLAQAYPGVTCNQEHNLHSVTVTREFGVGAFVVVATLPESDVMGQTTITMTEKEAVPTSIVYTDYITALSVGIEAVSFDFNAAVLDEDGLVIAGRMVKFTPEQEVEGVTLTADGVLTVQPTVAAGTAITIAANYQELEPALLTITIARQASRAVALVMMGNDAPAIPDTGSATYSYTALVTDQYGNQMETAITWTMTPGEGATLDNQGRLTLTAHAIEDTRLTLTAAVGNVSDAMTIVLVKSAVPAPSARLVITDHQPMCRMEAYGTQALSRLSSLQLLLTGDGKANTLTILAHDLIVESQWSLTETLLPWMETGQSCTIAVAALAVGADGYRNSERVSVGTVSLTPDGEGIPILTVSQPDNGYRTLHTGAILDMEAFYLLLVYGDSGVTITLTQPISHSSFEIETEEDVVGYGVIRLSATQRSDGIDVKYTPPLVKGIDE